MKKTHKLLPVTLALLALAGSAHADGLPGAINTPKQGFFASLAEVDALPVPAPEKCEVGYIKHLGALDPDAIVSKLITKFDLKQPGYMRAGVPMQLAAPDQWFVPVLVCTGPGATQKALEKCSVGLGYWPDDKTMRVLKANKAIWIEGVPNFPTAICNWRDATPAEKLARGEEVK